MLSWMNCKLNSRIMFLGYLFAILPSSGSLNRIKHVWPPHFCSTSLYPFVFDHLCCWHSAGLMKTAKLHLPSFLFFFPHGRPPSRRISRSVMKESGTDERSVFLTNDWHFIIKKKQNSDIFTRAKVALKAFLHSLFEVTTPSHSSHPC